MAARMVRWKNPQATFNSVPPSETSRNFTNQRFNFGNAGDNTQPGACFTPQGDNAAKKLPHHPGVTPRQKGY